MTPASVGLPLHIRQARTEVLDKGGVDDGQLSLDAVSSGGRVALVPVYSVELAQAQGPALWGVTALLGSMVI